MHKLLLSLVIAFATSLFATDLTFRRGVNSVTTLDPAIGSDTGVNSAMSLIFEPLLAYDYNARPYRLIPAAAKALPEISEDGLTYTFHLKEAYYTDDPCFSGKPRRVLAQDFVYGWKRLADRKVGGSGEWIIEAIEGIHEFAERSSASSEPTDYTLDVPGLRAIDDQTLVVKLKHPSNQFIWFLTMAYTAPVPPEAVAMYGKAIAEHPIGAGPYRLEKWWRNYELVFQRNPAWDGWKTVDFTAPEVPFETIRYLVVKDASTQWLMLLTGQLDFLEQIDRNNMAIAIDPEMGLSPDLKKRNIELFTSPTLKLYYIGINMEDPVLGGNKPLRQALNAAFDAARWTVFYRHRVEPLKTVAPPHIADALQTAFPYEFNLSLARQLMEQAGYPGGIDPKTGKRLVLTLELGNSTQDTKESSELLASFMDAIGVDLQLSINTWQAHLLKIRQRKAQMFLMGWVGDYPDIETFLQLFISRNQSPGPNRSNYINAEVDRLYDIATTSRNPAEITACWQRIQTIVREDCPWIFLHYALNYALVNRRVINYKPHDFHYGMERYYRTSRKATND